jgi:cation diffusion facilitator CzcD-associated flavoprotein CzcO
MSIHATSIARAPLENDSEVELLDVLVVGAGFSGLYQLERLRASGFAVKIYEAAPALGGVWYWNCYPGARCDTHGLLYQYSREELWRGWDFGELYPAWDEIREYFRYVDEKLDLSRDIRFDTRVTTAYFDEGSHTWTVHTDCGRIARARFLVLCTGIGSKPHRPEIPGLDDFAGNLHHTALWPQEGVDLAGQRIGVIGTGATGVQVIQSLAPVAAQLTVFQRTPNMAIPMRQRRLDATDKRALKDGLAEKYAKRARTFGGYEYDFNDYAGQSAAGYTPEQVQAMYERFWAEGGFVPWLGNFAEILTNERVNRVAYDFWRDKVRARIRDPRVADILAPPEPPHPYGVKRIALEQGYYEVFDRDNVRLVDLRATPIECVTACGVLTVDGREHALDTLILATGFDMVSGGLTAIDIRGTQGQTLREKWQTGVDAYLGSMTHGFPNMFFVYGPLAPAGLSNGPSSSELQGEEIVRLLGYLHAHAHTRIEATRASERAWRARVDQCANATLFGRAESWYMNANVPGKTRQMINYPLGIPDYLEQWRLAKEGSYAGFEIA